MRQPYITGMFLLLLIACSIQVVSSQTEQDTPVCSRTVYLEPSYQVYIDEFSIPSSFASFNVSFSLLGMTNIYSVYAYGPQNQSLQTIPYWDSTNNTYTVNINTTDINSFRLLAIIHQMAYYYNNFTVFVNFFPIVDIGSSASTSVYLPAGAQLLNYTESYLSNSTSGERALISGSKELTPNNESSGTVVYSGNYSLIEADSLSRVIKITPSVILMEETMRVLNSGSSTPLTNITLNAPEGATDLKAMDTIGYLNLVQSGQTITVDTRVPVYYGEYCEFTLLYLLPPSSLIQIADGRSVMSGNVLPDWFNMPARQVFLTVFLPPGSSDAQIVGGQITEKGGSLVANASYILLTPYTNDVLRISYTSSPYASYVGSALILIIIVVAVAGAFLYRKFKKGKKEVAPPPVAPSPTKPAPTPPLEKKKVPSKSKRR